MLPTYIIHFTPLTALTASCCLPASLNTRLTPRRVSSYSALALIGPFPPVPVGCQQLSNTASFCAPPPVLPRLTRQVPRLPCAYQTVSNLGNTKLQNTSTHTLLNPTSTSPPCQGATSLTTNRQPARDILSTYHGPFAEPGPFPFCWPTTTTPAASSYIWQSLTFPCQAI